MITLALERRALTERQVMKIHELKGFLDTKFVNFIKLCDYFIFKFFEQNILTFYIEKNIVNVPAFLI
jgi:hypothetical protein